MLNLDEPRFESYLKEFRPLPPPPLPLNVPAEAPRKPRHLGITIWAVSVAAILAIVILRSRVRRITQANPHVHSAASTVAISQPLTLGAANRILANSVTIEAALNSLEARSEGPTIPTGKESALAVLRQENPNP